MRHTTASENKMTNEEINVQIHNELLERSQTSAELHANTGHGSRVIENALRRLKTLGLVKFDKDTRKWVSGVLVETPAGNVLMTPLSAPVHDSEVVSGDSTAPASAEPAEKKENNMATQNSGSAVADIDAAINEAKNNKKKPKASGEPKTPRVRLSAEEKEARKVKADEEKAAKKVAREAARAAKKAAASSGRQPAHMSKVEKAASRLPVLGAKAEEFFNDLVTNLTASDVTALAAHLAHFNRTQATKRALELKVSTGDLVKIVSGDPRFVGQTGTITKAQRIRCYVELEGVKRPVYLFTSDVEVVKAAAVAVAV